MSGTSGSEKTISKIDAARRQILSALHIHWYMTEPLAVHALASAAWNLTNDLLKGQGGLRMIDEIARTHGMKDWEAEKLIKKPWNFTKHADTDPDDSVPEPSDEDCDALLETVCMDYISLTRRPPFVIQYFPVWYSAVYPEKTGDFMRAEAQQVFPGLADLPRVEQITAARQVISGPALPFVISDTRTDLTDNWRWARVRKMLVPSG